MRLLVFTVLILAVSACKNSGETTEESKRLGAQDADLLNARDQNFQARSCYCEFLLDSVEREPFVVKESVSVGKTENCHFTTGTDGNESHRLDSLKIKVYSGANLDNYNSVRSEFASEGWQEIANLQQSVEKGAEKDTKIEMKIGSKDSVYVKRTVAYDEFTGRLFSLTESSLSSPAQSDVKKVFDSVEIRYVDELFLNFQGACDSKIDL
ncbi:hypothetical protein N9D31_00620 [Oligoflexaceae bacterium]|nr:hypothetical protein [Oligoflexaceae bacterium]